MTARYRAPAGDGGLLAQPPLAEIGVATRRQRRPPEHVRRPPRRRPLAEFRRLAVAEVIEAAAAYLAEPKPSEAASPRSASGSAGPSLHRRRPPARVLPPRRLGQELRPAPAWPGDTAASPSTWSSTTTRPSGTPIRVPVVADDPRQVDRGSTSRSTPCRTTCPYEEHHVHDRPLFDTFPDAAGRADRHLGLRAAGMPTSGRRLRAEVDGGAALGEAVSRVRRRLGAQVGRHQLRAAGQPPGRDAGVRRVRADDPVATCRGSPTTTTPPSGRTVRPTTCGAATTRPRSWPAAATGSRPRSGSGGPTPRGGPSCSPVEPRAASNCGPASGRLGRLPTDGESFHAPGRGVIETSGWKVRPRALTLTLFTRLGFADGFIHGIGGGKYDEVTDDIIRRFFRLDPPGYAVVSATLRLPIRRFPATPDALRRAERRVRDLDWNPQRFPETPRRLPRTGVREGPTDRGRAGRPRRPPGVVSPTPARHPRPAPGRRRPARSRDLGRGPPPGRAGGERNPRQPGVRLAAVPRGRAAQLLHPPPVTPIHFTFHRNPDSLTGGAGGLTKRIRNPSARPLAAACRDTYDNPCPTHPTPADPCPACRSSPCWRSPRSCTPTTRPSPG